MTPLSHVRSSRPLVYAHRGGSALRPENTLASFDHGLSLGADGLELDVHLSRDGLVVVHHDDTLDRTTGGAGLVSSLTAAELASVDAGHWFRPLARERQKPDVRTLPPGQPPLTRPRSADQPPPRLRRSAEALRAKAEASGKAGRESHGEPATAGTAEFPFRGQGLGVPRLRDVLERYPGVPIIIELKVNQPELAHRTIDDVRAAGAIDRVSLGSFGWRVLHAAREYEPRIATGASREEARWALYRSWIGWPLGRPSYREFQVPERSGATTIISPRFIVHAQRAGLPVKVWTVDDPDDMRRLIRWGVDGLITDRPDLAVAAVRE